MRQACMDRACACWGSSMWAAHRTQDTVYALGECRWPCRDVPGVVALSLLWQEPLPSVFFPWCYGYRVLC